MDDSRFKDLKILIVDGNADRLNDLEQALDDVNVKTVRTATDPQSAFEAMKTLPSDIILIAWDMVSMDGTEFIKLMRRGVDGLNPYARVILMSDVEDETRTVDARNAGANDIMFLPIEPQSLLSHIDGVMKQNRRFIVSKNYIGPDRRTQDDSNYTGVERRKSDVPDHLIDHTKTEPNADKTAQTSIRQKLTTDH